ncbi:unannotated protein [freshwater metagenome]|uniref:Unannotated protein n=1 Tax=freshwater metagenome TaxID=449393 RepID=A0A6J6HTH9_9ZZZZ
MEAINKTLTHVLVDHGVACDVEFPLGLLGSGGQFAIQKKVCNFEIRRAFSKLLDGVAAVTKDAVVTIEVGDSRGARCGGQVRRVVHEKAGVQFA